MKSKRYLLASSAVMAAVLVTSAHAQTKTATTAAAVAEAPVIEELVVTAEKREQSLQDVPLAISAFSGKQRDLIGITSIQDYTNFTPGLVYSTFNDRASMRGIGRLTNIHAVDGAVAIYVDGVYTTSVVLAGNPPIETDRVEVLRGPQGTLYGRNAIGGTINIISPRPTDHPYAEVRAIAENYGFTNYQFAASGPLTEGLKVRLSGYKVDQTQGYYHNVNANMPTEGAKRNEWEYTFQASANLGENVETWIKYESLKWDNRGGPGARSSYLNAPYQTGLLAFPSVPLIYNPVQGYSTATGLAGIVPGSLQQFNGGTTTTNPALQDSHAFNTNTPLHVSLNNVHSLVASAVYHAKSFDVKYIGGLQNYNYDLEGDADGTNVKSYQIPLAPGSICGTVHTLFSIGRAPADCAPLTVDGNMTYHYFEHPKWFSNEVNISSTTDSALQYIAGLYYYHESYTGSTNDPDIFLPTSASLQRPVLGAAANPAGAIAIGDYAMTTESKAAFGQLDWKATPTLKFTAGLRYTQDQKSGAEYRRVVCNSDVCYPLLYAGLGLGAFGPGTAANWGSLLGNLNGLAQLGPFLGQPALAGLAGLGNGGFDLTTSLAPTTNAAGAKGVTDPTKCNAAGVCTQYTIDPTTGILVRHLGDKSDAWTGTLGVQWDPEEGTMAYGRYSRGYKALGFAAGYALAAPEAAPEFVNSYEVGLKKSFGRSLQVNAALYYLDYHNLQAPVSVLVGPTTATQFINVAQSLSDGLELDVIWQPIQPLRISLDYSYDHTRIQKSGKYLDVRDPLAVQSGTAVSLVGNRLPQAPENKFAINAGYSFYWQPGTLTLGATYIYRSEAYADVFTRTYNQAPSWDQVDLRANWVAKDGKYTVIGYVRNVADSEGYDAAVRASIAQLPALGGSPNLELTPPRTYGVELQYRFF